MKTAIEARITSEEIYEGLAYINDLITGATKMGLFSITITNTILSNDVMLAIEDYGYTVTTKYNSIFPEYKIEWVNVIFPTPSITPSPISITPTITPTPSYIPGTGFTTEWTLNASTGKGISLPLTNSGVYNAIVNWGDGTTSTITSYNDYRRIHNYTDYGTYIVEITGECPGWSFNNALEKLKITDIIYWGDDNKFGGFSYLTRGFYGCANLKSAGKGKILSKTNLTSLLYLFNGCSQLNSIDSGLFDNCTYVSIINNAFSGCTSLTTIPDDLFMYNTEPTTFTGVFGRCTSLTTIPIDLFKYNTKITSFISTFAECISLTTIPDDLFMYNTGVTISGFRYTFKGCTSLTTIPDDLFMYNTGVTTNGFNETFKGCTSLTTIPDDLFMYNTGVTTNGFNETFSGCTSLATIPTGLFKYNTKVTSFKSAFCGCNKLQLNPNIFYDTGEESTRFASLSGSCDFTKCFYKDSFTGVQGTAPNLWDCTFGASAECFGGPGNSTDSLDNYNTIPSAWGGGGM